MKPLRKSEFNPLDRRNFLRATVGTALVSVIPGSTLAATEKPMPDKPSPKQALDELMAGHQRYLANKPTPDDLASQRAELAKGQNPIAAVLSCADSRVIPDFLFDQPSGRLFVVRVAGNFVDDNGQASLEFGTGVLGIPLIVVLGHSSCGAVDAAIKVVKDDAKLPGKLPGLANAIVPAVKMVLDKPGNLLDNAIAANVRRNMTILRNADPIIGPAAKSGKIDIVGGVYDISTGRVAMLD